MLKEIVVNASIVKIVLFFNFYLVDDDKTCSKHLPVNYKSISDKKISKTSEA